jgi:hypothetical protein
MARTVLVKGFGWGIDVRCPRSTTWPEVDTSGANSISVTTVDRHQSPIAKRVRDFRLTGDRLRYDVTMSSFCFGQRTAAQLATRRNAGWGWYLETSLVGGARVGEANHQSPRLTAATLHRELFYETR